MTKPSENRRHDPVRVLVLWNRRDESGDEGLATRAAHARAVGDRLRSFGSDVHVVDIENDMVRLRDALTVLQPHAVVNLVEHYHGDHIQHAAIASYLELLGAACVGSESICLASCQDRTRLRVALSYARVPGPGFRIIRDINAIPRTDAMRPPFVVTQAYDDVYVDEGNEHPLADHAQFVTRCTELYRDYALPFLVEEYIAHRRLHAVIVGNHVLEDLPLVEPTDNGDSWQLAQMDRDTAVQVRDCARQAYRVMGCRDWAQIDIHLDESDKPHVVDVRPMFDLSPDAPFWAAARASSDGSDRLLADVVTWAHQRSRTQPDTPPPGEAPQAAPDSEHQ